MSRPTFSQIYFDERCIAGVSGSYPTDWFEDGMNVLGAIGVIGSSIEILLTNEVYPETFVKLLAAFPFEYVVADPSSATAWALKECSNST